MGRKALDKVNVHASKERRSCVTRPLISPRAAAMLRRKTRGEAPRVLN
jgi:hypothetical protein